MKDSVSVVGLGYVGLPLAVAAAKSGYKVTGIDLDEIKVSEINKGISQIEDINNVELSDLVKTGKIKAESNYASIEDAEIVAICVPTPLLENKLPDLSYLESAAKSIKGKLTEKSLLILESTVAPGTTREFLAPLLEFDFNKPEKNFKLAFSPERIDPMNLNWTIKNTPKIVAGLTSESKNLAVQFYSRFIDEVIECESVEVAETAKLLENSFRFINISFINELSIYCQKLGININDVVKTAATKPYGFLPFYPSIGVGGHCIPVDPIYLSNAGKKIGASTRFIDLADQINQEMPGYFVGQAEEKLGGLRNKKVLVVGVAYKSNVADIRESPVKSLITGLKEKGAQVFWHDDLVKEWNGEKSVNVSSNFDLAIIATPHKNLDLTKLGSVPILNTRGSAQ
ncbi:MAG: nucleotide sugar dehydrogenase [Polynucleobacter sp.]|nr:nucleotide sugar dehydrogenase [Polynucleobacter sp.]